MYVAGAEWSKALTSTFCCVCSRDIQWFEPSHDAYRQATLVVDSGSGQGPQHPYLKCLGRLSTQHEQRCSKLVAALIWGRQR